MEDRLRELRKGNPEAESEPISSDDVELGLGKGKAQDESKFMNAFFEDVGTIKTAMGNIRRNIKQIEEKYVQSITSVTTDQGNKSANEIQQLIDTTNKMVGDVRSMLEAMKKKNQQYDAQGSSTTETRIRSNMHGTLVQKFLELVQEYQEVQTDYKNKFQEKMERQFKIAKPDATPEEVADAIENGESSKVFAAQILDTHLHQQAKNALSYVEARHADIKKIEASIQQLHALFVDMAILVDAQGEMLNQIEYNVSQSVDYVKKGNVELASAIKLQKKSRKKMYIIICILVVIIIIVLVPTIITVTKKK